jgi:hypothetical protein
LFKQETAISEITDGTSNTIAIAEDAGRDPRYISNYSQNTYIDTGLTTMSAFLTGLNPSDPGPAGGYTHFRRYWRWAEPDEAFGVSGIPNNKYRPENEGIDWPTANDVCRPRQQRRQQRRDLLVLPRWG